MFNLLRKKNGQVRMTETIAILFIFFVLILFGIIFFYKYQQISIERQNEEMLASRAMDTTLKILYLPELICSKGDAEPEDNCFDMLKLNHVNKTFKDYQNQYYFDLFSYARISVQEVYPSNQSWMLYDKEKPNPEDVGGKKEGESTYFVVTIRDDISFSEPNYKFGFIEVFVYK